MREIISGGHLCAYATNTMQKHKITTIFGLVMLLYIRVRLDETQKM